MHEGPGAKVSYRGDDASGAVEDQETVGERDDDRGRDGLESGIEESKRRMQRRRQRAQDMDQGGVRSHDDGRQRRNLWLRRGLRVSGNGAISRHVVGENLVDAKDDVGKQQRGFNRAAAAAANAIRTEEDGGGHCYANEGSVEVADLRELGDSPEEVYGTGNDGTGEDEENDLQGAD